jgi:hypothetical protein
MGAASQARVPSRRLHRHLGRRLLLRRLAARADRPVRRPVVPERPLLGMQARKAQGRPRPVDILAGLVQTVAIRPVPVALLPDIRRADHLPLAIPLAGLRQPVIPDQRLLALRDPGLQVLLTVRVVIQALREVTLAQPADTRDMRKVRQRPSHLRVPNRFVKRPSRLFGRDGATTECYCSRPIISPIRPPGPNWDA